VGDPLDSWLWSLALVVFTTTLHVTALVFMGFAMQRMRDRIGHRNLRLSHVFAIFAGVTGAVGLLLTALHTLEAALWAIVYLWVGAVGLPAEAMVYSMDSLTTRGASGITLQGHWQVMGAVEAGNGMLLFGISTAFVFAVFQAYWSMLSIHRLTR
jgi:hypothetical protein